MVLGEIVNLQSLAVIEPSSNGIELAEPDAAKFQQYLRSHLTSDLVLQVLEECLLQENSTYNPIDFQQALKELQQRDSGRYQMLKLLLEGYATKEGQVMLDPKMVSASYKQRMKELEFLRSMGRFKRFAYRFFQALEGLFTEKNETEAIKEAIQITGEVQMARDELAVIELKKSQTQRDADKILTEASSQQRAILETANREATEHNERIYRESREAIARERTAANSHLNNLHNAAETLRKDIARLEQRKQQVADQKSRGYNSYSSASGVRRLERDWDSVSPSMSPSASMSPSPSCSPSPSPSDGW